MKLFFIILILILISTTAASGQTKTMAITIDDLPVVSTRTDIENRRTITKKLLKHLTDAEVPAIGFVNENKLYTSGKRDESQIDLLRMWLTAGFELGNHTYSHRSLHNFGLNAYEDDIVKGETVTKELLVAKNLKLRFFRHPYLQTGRSLEVKAGLSAFLAEHGYTIAPITLDNEDYVFSRAYDIAFDRDDQIAARPEPIKWSACTDPALRPHRAQCGFLSVPLERETTHSITSHDQLRSELEGALDRLRQ